MTGIFQEQGLDRRLPGRIMMIIDLSDCDIIYNINMDPDIVLDATYQLILSHLPREKWVIVLAVESP